METIFPALNHYLIDIKIDEMPTMIKIMVNPPI